MSCENANTAPVYTVRWIVHIFFQVAYKYGKEIFLIEQDQRKLAVHEEFEPGWDYLLINNFLMETRKLSLYKH